MRIAVLAVLAVGALSATTPARAQAFSPNYPVCLQVSGPDAYKDCSYATIAQCNASASGRAAQCLVNPYYAYAGPMPRHRRGY